MREARTPRRVSPHTVRCCAIQQMRVAMIQHSARGNETKSGEVSDPACSMPAAAVLGPRARMLVGRTLSRAASLTQILRLGMFYLVATNSSDLELKDKDK